MKTNRFLYVMVIVCTSMISLGCQSRTIDVLFWNRSGQRIENVRIVNGGVLGLGINIVDGGQAGFIALSSGLPDSFDVAWDAGEDQHNMETVDIGTLPRDFEGEVHLIITSRGVECHVVPEKDVWKFLQQMKKHQRKMVVPGKNPIRGKSGDETDE